MNKKIAVLISGNGSNLQALLDHPIKNGDIVLVVSNKEKAYGLERARKANKETKIIKNKNYRELLTTLCSKEIDLIVLAGFLDILPKAVVDLYPNQIINIHPSLIPSFCGQGFYGAKVHQAVLDYGAKVTGVTSHFVSEEADAGPIILQEAIKVEDNETLETLSKKVLKQEHILLCKSVDLFCNNQLTINKRHVSLGGKND